jgi:hypothetical protein
MSFDGNGQWTMMDGRNSSDAFAAPVAADFDNSQFIIQRSSLPLLLSFHLATSSDSDNSPFTIDHGAFLMRRSSVSDPRYSSHFGNLFLAPYGQPALLSQRSADLHERRLCHHTVLTGLCEAARSCDVLNHVGKTNGMHVAM